VADRCRASRGGASRGEPSVKTKPCSRSLLETSSRSPAMAKPAGVGFGV
jgi:hypothetical protein